MNLEIPLRLSREDHDERLLLLLTAMQGGGGQVQDPRFSTRPVISGIPAMGEYLTVDTVGTVEGTQPFTITGEWFIDGAATGVTITLIQITRPGNHRWKSTATNALGTATSFSNPIFLAMAADPDSFGLPAVFLTVVDPSAINAVTKTQATIAISNNFGSAFTDAQRLVGQEKIDLRWAGNSTGQADKKAYNMTTLTAAGANNDVPLLGMPAGRDWRLLANAYDLTDLKNWFCLGLGDELDLPWVPHGRHVEVFLNNVYQGVYFLAERVKRHVNRVNIGNAASGAFMCEIVADIQIDAGSLLFKTPLMDAPGPVAGFGNDLLASFSVESGTLSVAETAIKAFETALVARNWTTVWAQMDMPSAVDWFLYYDTNANIDGVRFGSVRIARDAPAGLKAGKFFFVPWDFDFSGGCPFDDPGLAPWGTPEANRYILNRWFDIIIEDPAFVAAVVARKPSYTPFFNAWISRLMAKSAFLDSTGARARNFARNSGQTIGGHPYKYASPAEGTVAAHDVWVARKAIVDADDYVPDHLPSDPFGQLILSRHPVAFYRLNEPGGSVMYDSSRNGLHGTYTPDRPSVGDILVPLPSDANVPGITYGVPGPGSDPCIAITSTRVIGMSDAISLNPDAAFTMEIWMKLDGTGDEYVPHMSMGVAQIAPNALIAMNAPYSGGGYYFDINRSGGASNRTSWNGVGYPGGAWQHVVFLKRADHTTEIWVDGVMQASSNAYAPLYANAIKLCIGNIFYTGSPSNTGSYADAAIYDYALTGAQIIENRDARLFVPVPPGELPPAIVAMAPVVWLTDTGSDPDLWEDVSGNGHSFVKHAASASPAIVPAAYNGLQCRRFSKAAGTLLAGSWPSISSATGLTIFMVLRFSSGNALYARVMSQRGPGSGNDFDQPGHFIPCLLNTRLGSYVEGNGGPDIKDPYLDTLIGFTTQWLITFPQPVYVYKNNYYQNMVSPISPLGTNGTEVLLGGTLAAGVPTEHADVDICEVLVFDKVLASADFLAMVDIILPKWGVVYTQSDFTGVPTPEFIIGEGDSEEHDPS